MTAELVALTEELARTTAILAQILVRLDDADRRARRHRTGTWVLTAVVICLAVLGGLFWQDQTHQARADCLRANRTRSDIRQGIVSSVAVGLSGSDRATEIVDRIENNLIHILPDRLCT